MADLPASKSIHSLERSARPRAFRRPKNSNGRRKTPVRKQKMGFPGRDARREPPATGRPLPDAPEGLRPEQRPAGNTRGSPGAELHRGSPYHYVECGGVLLSHTLSSAVPSPRPGLSFRVRKGTGRLTWAMTTAKPIQRPIHQGIGRQTEPATRPIPIVAVREPDNGRGQPALHQTSSS